ncbi:MAG: hypothetical protein R3C27_02745 [Hyphomonadaceae bacterium]
MRLSAFAPLHSPSEVFAAHAGLQFFTDRRMDRSLPYRRVCSEPDGFKVAYEIFVDRKPDFYRLQDVADQRDSTAMALAWGPRLIWRRLVRWFGGAASKART